MVGPVRALELLGPFRIPRTVVLTVLLVRDNRAGGRLHAITTALVVVNQGSTLAIVRTVTMQPLSQLVRIHC